MPQITCITEERALLGESPVWSATEAVVYWVDIRGPRLFRTDPATGKTDKWELPSLVGMISLRASGGLVLALEDGLHAFDPETGRMEFLVAVETDKPENRANDGKCDAAGRLWLGTMNKTDADQPTGGFYRIDPDLTVTQIADGFRIPNGLAWSPDNRTMHHTDTRSGILNIYGYDLDSGQRGDAHPVFAYDRATTGGIDGAAMDRDGGYWAAMYGGAKLLRLASDRTEIDEIPLPVNQPTMPAFGGPDMTTIFVTSASQELNDAAIAAQPETGRLLAIETEFKGSPVGTFGG
ncbi:MAG: SMP-30/gluconolactonase/LRE family protein [Proteobacteria bacterium]|nr:SMP-30/gluconolactonase/LRE family protein [Pseudomonadota bacterium]